MLKVISETWKSLFRSPAEENFTIIPAGTSFNGVIGAENLFIEGSIDSSALLVKTIKIANTGNVHSPRIDCDVFASAGLVTADVYAKKVFLIEDSQFKGNIYCDTIVIAGNAKVRGDIVYKNTLKIDETASFAGTIEIYSELSDNPV